MTRSRALPDGGISDAQVEYYTQRASAGLIISEATQVSRIGGGAYLSTPGIYTDEHEAGWKRVAEAVHERGGKFVVQLWHVGRHAHAAINGLGSVAPSAIQTEISTFIGPDGDAEGKSRVGLPHALTIPEIHATYQDFAAAAERAVRAGADGVEIHGAGSYLPQQFLAEGANQRTDEYGGSPRNRARFVIELVTEVVEAVGADRVGLKISPGLPIGELGETDPWSTYEVLLNAIAPLDLAYLHAMYRIDDPAVDRVRRIWPGKFLLSSGFNGPVTEADYQEAIERNRIDAAVIGRNFLANPDFVERLRTRAELNEVRPEHFYAGGDTGYIDYPNVDGLARAR
ncbi:oxidoreductase [Nocardia fluminea]|uniref:oxidoreductase n=1 Tax=Nocardia fluminea TaxID=134984 RepID=UPI001FE762D8|nr:alkene reductase [Nocardia fluminea]